MDGESSDSEVCGVGNLQESCGDVAMTNEMSTVNIDPTERTLTAAKSIDDIEDEAVKKDLNEKILSNKEIAKKGVETGPLSADVLAKSHEGTSQEKYEFKAHLCTDVNIPYVFVIHSKDFKLQYKHNDKMRGEFSLEKLRTIENVDQEGFKYSLRLIFDNVNVHLGFKKKSEAKKFEKYLKLVYRDRDSEIPPFEFKNKVEMNAAKDSEYRRSIFHEDESYDLMFPVNQINLKNRVQLNHNSCKILESLNAVFPYLQFKFEYNEADVKTALDICKMDKPVEDFVSSLLKSIVDKILEISSVEIYKMALAYKLNGRMALKIAKNFPEIRCELKKELNFLASPEALPTSIDTVARDLLDAMNEGEPLSLVSLRSIYENKRIVENALEKISSLTGRRFCFECDYALGYMNLAMIMGKKAQDYQNNWGWLINTHLQVLAEQIQKTLSLGSQYKEAFIALALGNNSDFGIIRIKVALIDPTPANRPSWILFKGNILEVNLNSLNFQPDKHQFVGQEIDLYVAEKVRKMFGADKKNED